MTQLISKKHAASKVDRHPVQVMRMVEAGKFPPPVRVGSRVYFVEDEVEQWIQDRIAERDETNSDGPSSLLGQGLIDHDKLALTQKGEEPRRRH